MNFLSEFKKVNISDEELLGAYIDFCLKNSCEKGDRHHILPRSLFPEYENLAEHPWNCAVLTPDNHYIAHSMLSESLNEPSMDFAWYAMNNKNYNNDPIHLIGADVYAELIEKRNKSCSDRMKNKVQALDTKTGKFVQVTKEEFDKTETLVGSTTGRGGDHLKNQVSVLIDGVAKRIPKEDFDPNIHEGITKGKTMYKDESGNVYQTTADDPRVLSGELVGIMKGRKFKNPYSKGQQISINIYNENDEIVFECYGNFRKTCYENNLPAALLSKTIKEGNVISYDFNSMRKCDITRLKNSGKTRFIGWYARKIK